MGFTEKGSLEEKILLKGYREISEFGQRSPLSSEELKLIMDQLFSYQFKGFRIKDFAIIPNKASYDTESELANRGFYRIYLLI